MDVQEEKLPNGIRVITSCLPKVQSVTFGIWVGIGARYEHRKLSGISHFIEHLLFKGTSQRSARDISREIEGYGGYLNAFTQEESTCYYARVASDHLWRALDVLADMYLDPKLEPSEIKKERGVIVEEIMMYKDQPQQVVQDLLTEALWKNHSLGRPIIGTTETLSKMDRSVIKKFKDESYLPGNTVFAFAGNLEHEQCVRRVEHLVGSKRGKRVPKYKPVSSAVLQEQMVLMKKDIEQTHMAMGIRIFGRHDKRRYALRLLNVILGENMSSRLFQVVREKYGLAYAVHSSVHLFKESGALVVSAGLDRKRTRKAVEIIIREITRLTEQPVGSRELKMAKEYVIGQLKLGLESTIHQMMWLGDNLMSYGKFMQPEDVIDSIAQVSADDICRLSRQIIRNTRTSLAMISPDIDGEGDEKKYLSILKEL
ncbi:MAG: pitrilysin family protein [Kiritimatiellae bacterium]|nr:pitrilysin family protein [Kiritimatiellia bacterium]MDD5520325.1 pitrilysin family protein [Kiritimatiellia bacterium]